MIMVKKLETDNVFIDTEPFIAANFNYQSRPFQTLVLLTKYETVFIYLTPVTVKEIEANIKERVETASNAFRKFQATSDTRIIKNLEGPLKNALYVIFDIEEVKTKLLDQFSKFMKKLSARLIQVKNVSIDDVFDQYFSQKAPFGAGKKKSEFPDAFVLSALRQWCQKKNTKMYVVSADQDMINGCENDEYLISIPKLEEFVDLVYASQNEPHYSFVNELFDENEEEVKQRIADQFPSIGFYFDEEEGEVDSINVQTVRILSKYSVFVEEERATFELSVEIQFQAEVTWMWGVVPDYPTETEEATLNKKMEVPVEIEIDYRVGDPHRFYISSLSIQEHNVVLSNSDDDDGYPYK